MTELATARPTPVRGGERIEALDVLRGVAVLGILVMNIQAFAMPFAAYSNPTVWTSGDALDLALWAFAFVFAEQKFMSIFSILFGAGVALMLDRLEQRRRVEAAEATDRAIGDSLDVEEPEEPTTKKARKRSSVARLHYRRTLGLFLIGMAHAYLLWYGDILVTYALCALVLYLVRNVRPSRLVAAGAITLVVPILVAQGYSAYLRTLPEADRTAAEAEMLPSGDQVNDEVEAYRGGWLEQMPTRATTAVMLQTVLFVFFVGWRAAGLMLLGMALYKWGVVTAQRPPPVYLRLVLWGFGLGFPLVLAGLILNLRTDFAFAAVWLTNGVLNYLGSVGVALGYLALVMLWCGKPLDAGTRPSAPRRMLAATGRMALTNYLLQTLICVFIFYGFGLGWFGYWGRAAQWGVVLAVWAAELTWSPWWLARFRFGPFEWLWRTFTYWRIQPFRRTAP